MSKSIQTLQFSTTTALTNAQLSNGRLIEGLTAGGGFNLQTPLLSSAPDGANGLIRCVGANALQVVPNGGTINGLGALVLSDQQTYLFWLVKGSSDWRAILLDGGPALAQPKKTIIGPLADRDGAGVNNLSIQEINNSLVLINSAAAVQAANLPAVGATEDGYVCTVKREGAGNVVNVVPNGADTIDGAASFVLASDKDAIELVYVDASTDWKVV